MAKTITTLSIDSEIKDQIIKAGYNMSYEVERHFQHLLNVRNKDIEGLDKEILEGRLNKLNSKIGVLVTEKSLIEDQLKNIDNLISKKKQERLEEDKKEAEAAKHCHNCGSFLPEKLTKHKFPRGYICNSCFLTAKGDQIDKWNQKLTKEERE